MLRFLAKKRLEREVSRGLADFKAMDGYRQAFDDVDVAPDAAVSEGPEVYQLESDEPWSVRDDGLADRLGLRSHHAAEKKVQQRLRERDPSLLDRIEFDSEADCFFAYTASERDALALREVILSLG